jgi:hypothetical protein
MFYLISILTTDFSHITTNMTVISVYMQSMEQGFSSISSDLGLIEASVTAMTKTDLAALPAINVGGMAQSMRMMPFP